MQADQGTFTYYVPLPSLIRNVELAFAVFFAGLLLYIPFRLGLDHTLQTIQNDPLIWLLLIAIFAPAIALSFFSHFLRRAGQPELRPTVTTSA